MSTFDQARRPAELLGGGARALATAAGLAVGAAVVAGPAVLGGGAEVHAGPVALGQVRRTAVAAGACRADLLGRAGDAIASTVNQAGSRDTPLRSGIDKSCSCAATKPTAKSA